MSDDRTARNVQAKFRCLEKTRRYTNTSVVNGVETDHFHLTVRLAPVMGKSKTSGYSSDENKAFYAATPCGTIQFEGITESCFACFKEGEAYMIDITPALG